MKKQRRHCKNCEKKTPNIRTFPRGIAVRKVTCPYCGEDNYLRLPILLVEFAVLIGGILFTFVFRMVTGSSSMYLLFVFVLVIIVHLLLNPFKSYEHEQ
ncbi:hypothetical protein [Bacillus sp. JCM 19041]|uniref:hypothetical protein n=1 Tax=Bacillus sp. JCM 19041 TaxID=1460637 RepID=UPI0006D0E6DA